MRLLLVGSCALFLGVTGFAQDDLKSDLLSHAPMTQVAPHLMALSEKTHEPSRLEVDVFARDLVAALSKKSLRSVDARELAGEIDAVFKSAGTSTVGFLEHIGNFKVTLAGVGVPRPEVDRLAQELEKIGREVRGPEDTPVKREPAQRRFR
jgi:hypothetical protein